MDVSKILAEIDGKIASLQEARAAIVSLETGSFAPKAKRGRPKGSTNAVKTPKLAKKRNLTPEGRARIAAAMQRRWAKQRKAAKTVAPQKASTAKKVAIKAETPKK
jgi:hypothetical protein